LTAREPRRALLDTSVVIDFPAAQVAEVADEVAVSAVTIAELQYGVAVASDPLIQMSRRRRVQTILDRFEVLSFDVTTAEYYGLLPASCANTAATRGCDAWTCRSPRPQRDTACCC